MATAEIATVDHSTYLALNHSTAEVQAIMRDNLGGQKIGQFDLPRVKVPAGGGTMWEVPALGGTESVKELTGIVVHQRFTRSYWKNEDPDGSPPDCVSLDQIVGVGTPGGKCETCPLAQFESSTKGGGQACKQQTLWFLLREESFLPIVLALPPTSITAAKQYMLQLGGGGVHFTAAVTTLSLEKDSNAGGQSFSRVVPSLAARLDPDAAARAREYAEALRPVFEATPVVEQTQPTTDETEQDAQPEAA